MIHAWHCVVVGCVPCKQQILGVHIYVTLVHCDAVRWANNTTKLCHINVLWYHVVVAWAHVFKCEACFCIMSERWGHVCSHVSHTIAQCCDELLGWLNMQAAPWSLPFLCLWMNMEWQSFYSSLSSYSSYDFNHWLVFITHFCMFLLLLGFHTSILRGLLKDSTFWSVSSPSLISDPLHLSIRATPLF